MIDKLKTAEELKEKIESMNTDEDFMNFAIDIHGLLPLIKDINERIKKIEDAT